MNSTKFLHDHAVKNIWCVPDQDINIILAPKRLSPHGGSLVSQQVLWDDVYLPNNKDWFFVYQIGNVNPTTLGLDPTYNVWISAQTHCNRNNLLINAYVSKGLSYTLRNVYFLRTIDGNYIVAVKQDQRITDLSTDTLHLRFYRNSFYNKPICPECDSGLVVWSGSVGSITELHRVQVEFRRYNNMEGKVTFIVNGHYVNDLNTATVQWGDEIQWVWDASIKEIVEYELSNIHKFLSTRDTTDKYLLFRKGDGDDTIDYYDDNDIYISRRINVGKVESLYYHRNAAMAVRQVTHRDYSIPVSFVDQLTQANGWSSRVDGTLRLYIRHSGLRRPLILEHHRIHELYKLSDEDRYKAMVGTDATIDVWKAASLEDSAYVKLMGVKRPLDMSPDMIYDAYGYNTMAMTLIGELSKVPDNNQWIKLKPGLHKECTGFEYDADGVLMGWYLQRNVREWPLHNKDAKYVELLPGIGSASPDIVLGGVEHTLDYHLNYGFYVCEIWGGSPITDWRYAVEDEDYILDGNKLLWTIDQVKYLTAVKADRYFTVETYNVTSNNFVYKFDINIQRALSDGVSLGDIPQIPFGQLDIWLNGHHLVKDIDYIVRWPTICIVNKKFLIDDTTQAITVRGTGLCNKDMSLESPCDTGFVSYGMLSYNHRFNIRDGKPIRIVADGRVLHRDEVHWSEDRGMELPTVPNGAPYQVMDLITPLRLDVPIHDQFGFRKESRIVDRQLSDYLTNKLPEPQEPEPNPIPVKYPLYSPMMSMILFDVVNGVIPPDSISRHLSDNEVFGLIESYSPMMKFDPIFNGELDLEYVSVHLHPLLYTVELSIWEWRFIRTVNRVRFSSRLDMSGSLEIERGYEYELGIK